MLSARKVCRNSRTLALPMGIAGLLLVGGFAVGQGDVRITLSSQPTQWQPLTLEITGPECAEAGEDNPFHNYRLNVAFSRQGKASIVPGYFAADGRAAETSATKGNVWRVHFVPACPGTWQYTISFRRGKDVAISDPASGTPVPGDEMTGSFEVREDKQAKGLLQYNGTRYLHFAGSGEPFLKSGADSPENLLAFHEFDGTGGEDRGDQRAGEAGHAPLHRYAPHVSDWRAGDPLWQGNKGKGLIGALNYLASVGVNSIYFLTMNVRGDGKDVWPWTSDAERFRFDCSKLDQWEIVFTHMDRLGMALHVVLTETENESLFEFEEGNDFAARRKLYYRELVARFAHHRALVWNIGEENGWDDRGDKNAENEPWRVGITDEQRRQFASYIRALDPYDHPIVVHTLPGRYKEIYKPLLGHKAYEGVSLQVHLGKRIHEETKLWIDLSAEAGRPWVANLDEIGPADDGVKPDADDPTHDDVRRFALWGNLMAGGGGCEWYFGYRFAHNDLGLEDFRSRANMWAQTRIAVDFFQQHLPFTEMHHADAHVKSKEAYCFAKLGEVYAVYIPHGGKAKLWLPETEYSVAWFDPHRGGGLLPGRRTEVKGGRWTNIGSAPARSEEDWVALVRRTGRAVRSLPLPSR